MGAESNEEYIYIYIFKKWIVVVVGLLNIIFFIMADVEDNYMDSDDGVCIYIYISL